MIRYEFFPRYFGDSVWNAPVLRAIPAPGSPSFEHFNVTQLTQFKAYSLHNAPLRNGNVYMPGLEIGTPREFANRALDAFLDISGIGFGNWHLMQGLFLPDISLSKKTPFYLGTLDPAQGEIELSDSEHVKYDRVGYDGASPYGTLIAVEARHLTELFSKLNYFVSLFERQEKRARFRHDEIPMPNSYIQVSEHVAGPSGNSENVSLLLGHFSR